MNPSQWRVAWVALFALYVLLAAGFSIIQPLGRTPDEAAHVQYTAFLADRGHFPLWQAEGGGEAGYEAQHPPLYYGVTALVYKATSGLEMRWRWQILRWATIALVGLPLCWLCRRFFTALFASPLTAFTATATVALMPLTLLYTGYVNPDGMTALWVTLALYLTWRNRLKPAVLSDYLGLGAVCGLALLTKLSGFPALIIALGAQFLPSETEQAEEAETTAPTPSAMVRCAAIAGACLLVCGWWYARSTMLYGSPFIHTEGKMGSGLAMAQNSGLLQTAWFTWRETFLSTWAQRGWFPSGFWEIFLYGCVIAVIVLSAIGLGRMRLGHTAPPTHQREAWRPALLLSMALILLVFLGQQWAFWTQDVEFNAGGRYLLSAMAGCTIWMIGGLEFYSAKTKQMICGLWLGALLLMSLISAWNIDTVLNPTYAPNSQYFHFPPGEER